ncbi:Zn-dependent hydrolase [Candidatus Pacearchaeota archaeon CG10_big_fil_rev_8_21_14_0_10_35_219]|nr:MBL fold metallo-hydrolase [Candidatus Pacearchaeota archaeon]PIO07825.1 MAG: Zn-dependent hydrolase [Candidatus Pacearchaeota archaeon CG10_big_fil_rev_8_21_14_0_10_35_219]PIY81047.1 MAG: Zn-dependent hydrolase [Candidatus Pacearchaeota archaeon CG_4_10_14_0_8_um_filter_35_169]PIZ79916.1 MAG: Zn-dependent hydrolase [Candidatus Pacearchaeota archaeon CG_4_10_14_0_2_um_filter_35_33]PJA70246.1 MAG: Zn-dependent hydrolase [Candidatus Pacearchaeota archaeon CG_4_9_14_3_um_filter_35_19]PJB93673.
MKIGDIDIEFLGHSGFLIRNRKRIVIDPYKIKDIGKVDLILITHGHYDHCSIEDIEKLVEPGTVVVCTADVQSKILKIEGIDLQIVEAGYKLDLDEIRIEAVPAYNIRKDYHPKEEGWIGFVIKIGNNVFYHAGDSDFIPEMHKLTGHGKQGNKFVALLPVSGKYVMTAEQAAEAASVLSPDLAIPMHYGAGVAGTLKDAERFIALCKEKNIKAIIMEKLE